MKKRIWELDFLRGFAIIMMIFDHLMFDFKSLRMFFGNFDQVDNEVFNWLKEFGNMYWHSELRFFGHFVFLSIFMLVSGISFTFSKSNLSRGLKLSIVAMVITLITFIVEETLSFDALIIFGIIHLYAVSILITYVIRKFIKNDIVIMLFAFAIIAYGISFRFWSVSYLPAFSFSRLPEIIIGLKGYGADYFGLVPYLGIILLGTVIGNQFYHNKTSIIPQVKISEKNIFMIAGRKSLIIFVTHQIVLIALIYIIGYIFEYRI